FFQAEDGIRDFHVTGVQTCALPISIPIKFFWGNIVASPIAYSPLPQANSSVTGLSFLKCLLQFPFIFSGNCNTLGKVFISAKRTNFFCPITAKDKINL